MSTRHLLNHHKLHYGHQAKLGWSPVVLVVQKTRRKTTTRMSRSIFGSYPSLFVLAQVGLIMRSRPIWDASTQEMPYDYQNQFSARVRKKTHGNKDGMVVEIEDDQVVVIDDEPTTLRKPTKRRGHTSKRKSAWRGRRGRGRARKRGT